VISTIPVELAGVALRLRTPDVLGLPGATDIDFEPILPLFNLLAINVGHPTRDGVDVRNLNAEELQVCAQMTRIFRGDPERWSSYIASGTTGAIRHALRVARDRLPRGRWGRGPVLYASEAAHSCIRKIANDLRLHLEPIPAVHGAMDIAELGARVHPGRAAILLVTIGTTMVEGVDDATLGRWVLREMGATEVWVHADAALSGLPLALDDDPPEGARLDRGVVDSLEVSGHKFVGTKLASAWCVIRADALDAPVLPYTGTVDSTAEGCRSGHNSLLWWWVLHTQGVEGLRRRAAHARALAERTCDRLLEVGVPASRYPWAFTVAFPAPSPALVARWGLACAPIPQNPARRIAHVVTMPGVDEDALDRFTEDMGATW
jgi:histidine decarboxylase